MSSKRKTTYFIVPTERDTTKVSTTSGHDVTNKTSNKGNVKTYTLSPHAAARVRWPLRIRRSARSGASDGAQGIMPRQVPVPEHIVPEGQHTGAEASSQPGQHVLPVMQLEPQGLSTDPVG